MGNDKPVPADVGTAIQPRRPFSRSHTNFQNETTESGFLPAEEKLIDQISRGEACKISSLNWREPSELDLLLLDSAYRIRADFLRFLALGGDESIPVHEHGILLEGAFVHGTLDLSGCQNLVPLSLVSCVLSAPVKASESTAIRLVLSGSRVEGIEASNARFSGDIKFDNGFEAVGGVDLNGTTIGGHLDCWGGTFINPEGVALSAIGCKIGGDVKLNNGFEAEGRVNLNGAAIGGNLSCWGSAFTNPFGVVLSAYGCQIGRNVLLRDGFKAVGAVDLMASHIGGHVLCSEAQFKNSGKVALSLRETNIAVDCGLNNGFEADGEVILDGAKMGGDLDCWGGTFINPEGEALSAIGCKIGGDVKLNNGFEASGQVNLNGATIGGHLSCWGSVFTNPFGVVLSAYGCQIGRNVLLRDGFKSNGAVDLKASHIGGDVRCSEAQFKNPGKVALALCKATIAADCGLDNGFEADGKVDLDGAKIGGDLDCWSGTFMNPEGKALSAIGCKIGRNVLLTGGFEAQGAVRFADAEISNDFWCVSARLRNDFKLAADEDDEREAPDALSLVGAKIHGALRLINGRGTQPTFLGSLNLHNATVGRLFDHPDAWPPNTVAIEDHGNLSCAIKLDGFQYAGLAGDGGYDAATRLRWLGRMPAAHRTNNLSPGPYEKMAQVLTAIGREEDAREIRHAKEKLLARSKFRQSHWISLPFLLVTTGLFGLFAGHGYRQNRLIFILLALWIGAALFYNAAAKQGVFAPANPEIWLNDKLTECWSPPINWTTCTRPKIAALTPFDPWLYSADVMVPFIDLKQRSSWVPMSQSFDIQVPFFGTLHIASWVPRAVMAVENVGGALGILLLGIILSGILKQE